MSMPLVAIVGRPNVGKSAFFNHIIGERLSIVDNEPGITRDRLYAHAHWAGVEFSLVDTGGIEPESDDLILSSMREQANIAIETADVIVFITDIKTGLTAADESVAQLLRKSGKPVIVAVNKVDNPGNPPPGIYEFYNLGMGEVFPISAIHGLGTGDLLDEIIKYFPADSQVDSDEDIIAIAFIGKPNAGKSSIVNKILGQERSIVTDIPGTTRDAIDTVFENRRGKFLLTDTAGLRRRGKVEPGVEKYSVIRSLAAIDRSDVCVIVIDGYEGITEQDTKIAGYAHEAGKASVFAVNKWDLVEKTTGTLEKFTAEIKERFSFMSYAPVVFISAKTGQRLNKLLDMVVHVNNERNKRLSTGALNDLIGQATAIVPTPQNKGRHLRIYYGTQVSVKPPTFALFINDKELMHFSYERYLENQFRKFYGFEGTPIRFVLRPKETREIRKGGILPGRKGRRPGNRDVANKKKINRDKNNEK